MAKITDRFNPREVIKLSLWGEKQAILSGDAIWLCCSCYNCQERCPQKVEIADVIYALRKKRADYGLPPLQPAGLDAVRKILSCTGFDKLCQKKEEAS